jgi:hypothetical protein
MVHFQLLSGKKHTIWNEVPEKSSAFSENGAFSPVI